MGAKVILVNATHEQNTDMGRRAQVSSTDPVRPLPEITSSSSMSLSPFLKSSSMFSICVPALRRWELHQAVKVWREKRRN